MTAYYNIYGPPGTGKTTRLTALFTAAAQRVGPAAVGAVTYTRAAAAELKTRAAAALGLRADARTLARELPFVGTIHSLCYRALGGKGSVQLVDEHNRFRQFCEEVMIAPPADSLRADPEALEGFWYADRGDCPTEAEVMRRLVAAARHRRIALAEAVRMVPVEYLHDIPFDRLEYLANRYEEWKRREQLFDFEDLLEQGASLRPPVRVLFADEVQDNSPLMWHVLDEWARSCELFVAAGDAYQSIYLFSGADPRLFTERPGKWLHLGDSHRLSPASVAYANAVLRAGGWDDERFIGTWTGVGGNEVDGRHFYLARTHGLVAAIRADLIERGEPFLEFRGRSPWASNAGDAYRVLTRLLHGETVPERSLATVAKALPSGLLRRGLKTRWEQAKSESPVDAADVRRLLGDGAESLEGLRECLPHSSYLARVEARYGLRGLVLQPKTIIGTIHAAKGREADRVSLVRSWAFLPAEALADPEGARAEACVAYVAVTRHRTELELLDTARWGIDYPWPERPREVVA